MQGPQRLYQERTTNSVESGISAIYKACRFYIFSTCTFRPGEKSRPNSMLNVITVMNSLTNICVVSNHDNQTRMAQQRKWQSIHGRECKKVRIGELWQHNVLRCTAFRNQVFFPYFCKVKHTILLYEIITVISRYCYAWLYGPFLSLWVISVPTRSMPTWSSTQVMDYLWITRWRFVF
jgi:hypothetical protein